MEAIENLIFGDPVYDCKGRVVRRNFGIKNALVIILIVYGLYSLRGKMTIKSGRRKLRGGDNNDDEDREGGGWAAFVAVVTVILIIVLLSLKFEGKLDPVY